MQDLIMQNYIDEICAHFKTDKDTQKLFTDCFLSTISTTVKCDKNGVFVVTGDIPAMWLRDSAAQVRHYLPLANNNAKIKGLIAGLIKRQIFCINIDPYANSFNSEPNGHGHNDDIPEKSPWVWERKYEVDSLCYPLQLAYLYWKETGSADIFDSSFLAAAKAIVSLWTTEQNHAGSPYSFMRKGCPRSDTLPRKGKGSKVAFTGMTWSGFRPSDDACKFGYLIPANMFASVVLLYLEEILAYAYKSEEELRLKAAKLRGEILHGIEAYGTYIHPQFGKIYAYETDGLGNYNLMDDANVPSLLSLPYIGFCSKNDEVYQNTRRFVLSSENPYYYQGKCASGIGSPHTPKGYIWHIALAVQALTSSNMQEKSEIIAALLKTHADTYQMHEGFNADNPYKFTRKWFAWANTICSQAVIDYYCDKPKEQSN